MNTHLFCYFGVYGPINGYAVINSRKAMELEEDSFLLGKFPPPPPSKVKPKVLYAVRECFYLLHLGMPDNEPRLPTWRELFEFYRVDWNDPDIRFRFLETTRLWDPYSDQPEPKLNLDMEIYGAAVDLYEMNPFDDFLNPMSCAYRYLLRTPFYRRGKIAKGEVVGDLQLFRKNEFHADYPQAWASDVMSLACLQHCLNRIGANIRIEILKNPPATSGQ